MRINPQALQANTQAMQPAMGNAAAQQMTKPFQQMQGGMAPQLNMTGPMAQAGLGGPQFSPLSMIQQRMDALKDQRSGGMDRNAYRDQMDQLRGMRRDARYNMRQGVLNPQQEFLNSGIGIAGNPFQTPMQPGAPMQPGSSVPFNPGMGIAGNPFQTPMQPGMSTQPLAGIPLLPSGPGNPYENWQQPAMNPTMVDDFVGRQPASQVPFMSRIGSLLGGMPQGTPYNAGMSQTAQPLADMAQAYNIYG